MLKRDAKERVLKRVYEMECARGVTQEAVLVRGWSGGGFLESLIRLDKDSWVLGQATKQASSQALRRHSVGAMPCRGLLKKFLIQLKQEVSI